MPGISRLAIVDKAAAIARDVRIGPFCCIGPEVRIGPGCIIESNVTITGRTTLGARNHVFAMAVIGAPHQGPSPPPGECILGDANAIREHVTVYAGNDRPTRLGSDNLVMIASQVGAGATVGDHGIFANCTQIDPEAVVEDYVRTSAFAVVRRGATVGAYTFIAGYAEVDRYAPPYAIVYGFPFRIRGVNVENLKRCGFGEDDIRILTRAFREIFRDHSDHLRPDGLDALRAELAGNPHVGALVEFIRRHAKAAPPGGPP